MIYSYPVLINVEAESWEEADEQVDVIKNEIFSETLLPVDDNGEPTRG